MPNPDAPDDEFIEKLARAEEQAYREERRGIFFLAAIVLATLFCIGLMMVAFAAEPTPTLPQEGEHPGGVVKMTRPDGTAIWVNPRTVAFIRGPLEGEQGHTTIVFSSGAKQSVLESIDEIGRIMKMERQHLPDSDDPP